MKLRTVTPLWTGGIDPGKADRLHETGIIGSLRWWYEAILRGCGVQVCDPTTHNCTGCPACQAYGMTGQRRQWRLTVDTNVRHPFDSDPILIPSGRLHPTKNGVRAGGWYLGNGYVGTLTLQALPLHQPEPPRSVWELPLHLAARWGGIGPKTQIGYGVVNVCDDAGNIVEPDTETLLQGLPTDTHENNSLPDLRHFFFAILEFKTSNDWWKKVELIETAIKREVIDAGQRKWLGNVSTQLGALARHRCVPVAPAFRNWLRYGKTITTRSGDQLQVSVLDGLMRGRERDATTELFGEVQGNNRQRSRLNVSSAYFVANNTWEIRIWGWIPPSSNYDRDEVLGSLYDLFDAPTNWEPLLGIGASDAELIAWSNFEPANHTMPEYLRYLLT